MNSRESAAVGQLVIEGKHAFWRKGAWVSSWIMARVHGAVVIDPLRGSSNKGYEEGCWSLGGTWPLGDRKDHRSRTGVCYG